jgi:hypothetical protein
MMIEAIQHGHMQAAVPDFDALLKLIEGQENGQIRDQEITKIREIQARQDKRDAQRTKRDMQDQLSRRWLRHATVDNTCSALSLFNLRF